MGRNERKIKWEKIKFLLTFFKKIITIVVSFVCGTNEISDRLLNKIMKELPTIVCNYLNNFQR